MAERQKGENQPTPIEIALKSTAEIFGKANPSKEESKQKPEEGPFKGAVDAILQKMGGEKDKREAARGMVLSGAGAAMGTIQYFAHFWQPSTETRQQVMDKILEEKKDAEGLEIYVKNDPTTESGRTVIFSHFREEGLSNLKEKLAQNLKEAKDENERAAIERSIDLQLEAFGKGFDTMKGIFSQQLKSASGSNKQLALAA